MLTGRELELQRLEKVFQSTEAEFTVLYGRRRVGKTYLIRYFFGEKNCQFFQATGLQGGALKKQLSHFAESLSETFTHRVQIKPPASWEEAFQLLTQFIETASPKNKTVIFLDELPWMAGPRSGLLQALDYYWNHHWSKNPNVILIVCGSSASWLIKNIIYNKGGLHNRCTCEIRLEPFTLSETRNYLKSRNIRLNDDHILELYMALGGVPYYLRYVEPGQTAAENIQNILFAKTAPLKDEFTKLFHSLFADAEAYIELIKLIAKKKEGISRALIEKQSKLSQGGGRLTQRLNQLIQTHFIESYLPWDKQRGEYYKLIDEFCLFYIHWLEFTKGKKFPADYWIKQTQKPNYYVWSGYAFEAVCHKHIEQIIQSLKVKSVEAISSWRLVTREKQNTGVQIDLLLDRSDDAITLCEIKYTNKPFVIDKQYAENLQRKNDVFIEKTGTKKQIFISIISANGVKPNQYSRELISSVVTLKDLFK